MPAAVPANDSTKAGLHDALSMSLLLPEPEVLRTELASVNCKTLAKIVAGLLTEHEPMLKAEVDGVTATVTERGEPMKLKITVEAL